MNSLPFEKISTKSPNSRQNNSAAGDNSKTIETIKLLGKQIIEIRGIIEEQEETIKSLRKEVYVLKEKHNESEGNLKLSLIDQKDIAKQLRRLKANVDSSQITFERTQKPTPVNDSHTMNSGIPTTDAEIKERYFPDYQNSKIIQKSKHLNSLEKAVKEEPRTVDEVAKQFIFGRMPKLLNLEN